MDFFLLEMSIFLENFIIFEDGIGHTYTQDRTGYQKGAHVKYTEKRFKRKRRQKAVPKSSNIAKYIKNLKAHM